MNLFGKFSGGPPALLFAACLAAALVACGGGGLRPVGKDGSGAGGDASGAVRLQGTGATFPMPLYQKWLSEYEKVNPNARIDYQSTGSGTGIKQISEQTVDFGASDKPMSDEELQKAQGGELLHVPTALGAVAVTYNVPGIPQLKLTGDVLADIYLGKIRRWDDPRIKEHNPGTNFPSADITVVSRADGSGTSAVFTDYLSKVSPEWKQRVGTGTNPNWPAGQRSKGNEGVTATVKQTPNSLGYVELVYAQQNKLPVAALRNASGSFVEPTLASVTAAAASAMSQTPPDMRVSITDAAGAEAYPISSYTYVLVYKNQRDARKGRELVNFLWWATHDGQQFAESLGYSKLPQEVVQRTEGMLRSISADGKPLRQ